MQKKHLILGLLLFVMFTGIAQENITGKILDSENHLPIPFVTVLCKQTNVSTISNQKGEFTLFYENRNIKDSLSFKVLGYETQNIAIKNLKDNVNVVQLRKKVHELKTVFLTNKKLDAKGIVKKVIENIESNYVEFTKKDKIFCQRLLENKVSYLNIDYEKITIPWLTKEKIKEIETDIPKHYKNKIGFIADTYSYKKDLKIKPFKILMYETERAEDMDFFKSFMKMLSDTNKNEYWKLKTGVLGQKLEKNDSLDKHLYENTISSASLKKALNRVFKFQNFENNKKWEFLYKTYKYEYTLIRETVLNDEDIYHIEFKPKKKANYIFLKQLLLW